MLALSTKHRIDAATAMLPRRVRYTIGPSSLHPLCLPSGLLPSTDGWFHRRNEVASYCRQRRRQMVRFPGFRLCCGCLAGVQSS